MGFILSKFLFYQEQPYGYNDISKIATFVQERVAISPKVGIICGSGLGSLGEVVNNPVVLPYSEIPNFPISTVEGHSGKLIFGLISNKPVVCMQGRFHYYEGYPLWKVVMPIRLMKLLGVTHLIVSNAAGGINPDFKVGDVMLIKDHLNMMGLAGNNPLIGKNYNEFGPRFPSMKNAYDGDIIKKIKLLAKRIGFEHFIKEGVYGAVGGPNYETIAEIRALYTLGCDAVGMSTAPEIITARHCNIICFAFSLITNACARDYETKINPVHEEVIAEAKKRENDLKVFIQNVIPLLLE